MPAQLPQLCLILCDPMGHKPGQVLCPGASPGKNTGVGCHALFKEGLAVFNFISICWSGEVFIFFFFIILFFSEGYFQIFFFGSFPFQHLEYIIPLSPGPLGFC